MSSTSPPDPSPHVDRTCDGTRLRVELAGELDVTDVVTTMARARHLAEQCETQFDVLIDVREFDARGNALAVLGEWETFLRVAGATTVVRVGDGRAVSGADRSASSIDEAEELLSQ